MTICCRYMLCILSGCLVNPVSAHSQHIRSFNNNVSQVLSTQNNSHSLFKLTLFIAPQKGTSIGLGYGIWKENPSLQYSLNTAIQWRLGKGFLGNYRSGYFPKDSRTKSQLVCSFSPMFSVNMSKQKYVYQELEPFYLGTPNAVFSRFKYSLTLGSTFTISPRGTYHNVTTLRNRAQQDFMISLNLKNFNITIYDDYFPIFTDFLQLGDNWDRFFTGGGFIRYRFNDMFTFHLYSEVYTGINRANAFLRPDIISYKKRKSGLRQKNFANQDPGQEFFNSSWLIAKMTYSGPQTPGRASGVYLPSFDFLIGTSASWTTFSQDWIHNLICYDRKNKLRLHYFLPRSNIPGNLEAGGKNGWQINWRSLFLGGGFQTNISMP